MKLVYNIVGRTIKDGAIKKIWAVSGGISLRIWDSISNQIENGVSDGIEIQLGCDREYR